jgi:hypothetical protein
MTRITARFCALWSIVLGVLFLWFVGQWLMVLGMRLDTWSAEWTAEMKASRLQREAISEAISLQSDFASHNCGKRWCGGCENELAVAVYDRDRSAAIRRDRSAKSSEFGAPGQLFTNPVVDGMLNPVSPWRLLSGYD